MKLLFPKQNYIVLSPSSYTHISVRDLYISRIGLPILLQENMYVNQSWEYTCINRWQTHEYGNWDWGRTIPRKEIHKWDFVAVFSRPMSSAWRLPFSPTQTLTRAEIHTDKKENQIFLIYKEIQSGAVAKSYMSKGFIIYEEMHKYFPMYEDWGGR